MLVPLSTALVTAYDDIYLGVKEAPPEEPTPKRRRSRRP
jgi:hypothetical protein